MLFCSFGRTLLVFAEYINFMMIISYSLAIDVNPSLALSIVSVAAFATAFIFKYYFNEQINQMNWIGMIFIVVSIFFISHKQNTESQQTLNSSKTYNVSLIQFSIPIILALVQALIHAISTLFLRIATTKGLSTYRFTADTMILLGIVSVVMFMRENFTIQ